MYRDINNCDAFDKEDIRLQTVKKKLSCLYKVNKQCAKKKNSWNLFEYIV